MLTFGIIGNGFVGQATKMLKSSETEMLIYDISPEKCEPLGTTIEDLAKKCDIIFISVPTPMDKEGRNYMGIVTSVVDQIKSFGNPHIVIRSTVLPGLSSEMDSFFMPEFLTEKNWSTDFYGCCQWIFGLLDENDENDENVIRNNDFKVKIQKLIGSACKEDKIKYDKCIFVKNKEAEMIKYFRNTFLALKVGYCNELYDYCVKKGIDYDVVQKIATLDPRIGSSHSKVPGHDGKRGFGGTCFPKDTSALLCDFQDSNVECYILKGAVERNRLLDRPEQDWMEDKGRATV